MLSSKKRFDPAAKGLQALRDAAAVDPFAFIEDNFIIVDPDANAVPFKFRWQQREWGREVAETMRLGEPVRRFDLKSRRVGFSSSIAAYLQANVWARDNYKAAIIAHEESRAREILTRCRLFHRNLHPKLQLPFNKDRQDALEYAITNSSLAVGTAANPRKVRGEGLIGVQISEGSYFGSRFDMVMREIGPVVPYRPGTAVFIETTGHLRGSQAHQFWLDCKKGRKTYTTRFWGWLEDPTAVAPFRDEKHKQEVMARIQELCPRLYEKNRHFKLSAEQIHYAYLTWLHNCDADYDYFCTEYPYNEQEAWTLPGSSYFGDTNLQALVPSGDYTTYVWGNRLLGVPFQSIADDLTAIPALDENSGTPYLRIWEMPEPHHRYVIGSDVSGGEEKSDFSAMYVVDMVTRKCMATMHGRIRPDEHAVIMYSLHKLYNRALAAPEVNFGGMGIVDHLARLGVPIYRWKRPDKLGGLTAGRSTGWTTTGWSRDYMLGEMRKLVAECGRLGDGVDGIFRDRLLIDEMNTFAVNVNTGKAEAMNGHWDDRVVAFAIAQIVASQEVRKSLAPTLEGAPDDTVAFRPKQIIKPGSPLFPLNNLIRGTGKGLTISNGMLHNVPKLPSRGQPARAKTFNWATQKYEEI